MTAAENKRADNSRPKAAGYRLCVYASGSLITDIFSSLTHISVSCLHFGQNSGKFLSTVSMRIFVRVLLLQIGQLIHSIIIQQVHCSRNGWQEHLCPYSSFGTNCPKLFPSNMARAVYPPSPHIVQNSRELSVKGASHRRISADCP